MRDGWRRFVSIILSLVIVLGVTPIITHAARSVTVTVTDENGNPIEGAEITASLTSGSSNSFRPSYDEQGSGKYTVSYGANLRRTHTVTLTVSAPGYETGSISVAGNSSTASIQLVSDGSVTEPEPTETEPIESEPETTTAPESEWQDFMVYYYISEDENNLFPSSYAGSGDSVNYGPSRDNTPFVTVSVDIGKLKREYSDVAIYQDGSEASDKSNSWQFVPGTSEPNVEDATKFWNAVLDCMSEESLAAYKATGISEWFIGYVLKQMSYGSTERHIDGILKVSPPVYSIELYLNEVTTSDDANYVGGLITNSGEDFKTMSDVLTALEGYLGHTITWNEDESGNPIAVDGVYTGTYIENNIEYTITVQQSDKESSLTDVDGSEIRYVQRTSIYYIACFVLNIEEEQLMEYTVTYKDGEANGQAFYDHTYGVVKSSNSDPKVPAFPYEATWTDRLFLGWVQEGGDGTILSNAEVQELSVTQDMVFIAQWQNLFTVLFHPNNDSVEGDKELFRTYYSHSNIAPEGGLLLSGGKVDVFYDIPTFTYNVHNGFIFKGWYLGTEETAAPMDWNAVYTEETHIYAHWISVGEVLKEEDGKIYESSVYPEYDLLGNQIRVATENPNQHYGDAAPGLRFIASLSERVYQEMNLIHTENHDGIEYGFVIAATNAAQSKAEGEDYMLKYKHTTINGEDTTSTYSYVNNIPCRVPDVPVDDHYAGEQYRLYTAVITYKGLEGDRLTQAQNTYFIGRAYLRYFDANGLERVHYNNYTGNSQTYGGVNTCYTEVNNMVHGL